MHLGADPRQKRSETRLFGLQILKSWKAHEMAPTDCPGEPMHDVLRSTYDVVRITNYLLRMTYYVLRLTYYILRFTYDILRMTYDVLGITC